jgi:hypothetical protein
MPSDLYATELIEGCKLSKIKLFLASQMCQITKGGKNLKVLSLVVQWAKQSEMDNPDQAEVK